ncbi:signal peptidase II [Stackebrandtia soli]|uniref:signal peptidase II n=1 Tax=Stackebrandtia soli TaxID=1892856 RepID=UPI0039E8A27B
MLFGAVALVSIGIDVATKALVVANLVPGEPVRLLGGAVYLSLTRNSGAAFSFAKDFTPVLTVLATVVTIAIVWYAYRKLGSWQWAVALGMVAGGACGNLMDRLFRPPGFMVGHVVDFVSVFHPYGGYFAIFNMADSSLVLGVIWVILLELTGRGIDGTRIGKTKQDDTGAA